MGYERTAFSGAYGERAEAPHHEHTACGKPGPGFDTVIEVDIAGDRIGRAPTPHAPEERVDDLARSEEHTSDLQSLMRISYAVFCLKKKTQQTSKTDRTHKT